MGLERRKRSPGPRLGRHPGIDQSHGGQSVQARTLPRTGRLLWHRRGAPLLHREKPLAARRTAASQHDLFLFELFGPDGRSLLFDAARQSECADRNGIVGRGVDVVDQGDAGGFFEN